MYGYRVTVYGMAKGMFFASSAGRNHVDAFGEGVLRYVTKIKTGYGGRNISSRIEHVDVFLADVLVINCLTGPRSVIPCMLQDHIVILAVC